MSRTPWPRGRAFLRSYWTPAGKQALGNLVGLVACTGISQACALGVLLLLTYGLPQEGFGAVIFALNLQSYLVAVGTFGLTTIVVRDLTLHPDKSAETITAYLTIVSVASVLVGVATALAAAFLPISADERVMLWCIAAGNVAACLNLNPLFDAAHKQALAAALMVPGDLLMVGAVAALYATDALTVPLVGFILLGKWALAAALQAMVYFRRNGRVKLTWTRERFAGQLQSGWPILVAGLLYMVPFQAGLVFVRSQHGGVGAATYGIALQAALVYMTAVWILSRIVYTHMNREYGHTQQFATSLWIVVGLSLGGLWVVLACGAAVTIIFCLPPEYSTSLSPVLVLLTAAAASGVAAISSCFLTAFGRERLMLASYASGAIVFGVGAALFGHLSATATALVALAATATVMVASGLFVRACRQAFVPPAPPSVGR